jgi:hypothetical protein
MSKQFKNKLLKFNSKLMSTEYINELGENISILGNGAHQEETTPVPGVLTQLLANSNFGSDDANDYSTVSRNIPLSLIDPIANGIKTYAVDIQTFINNCDVTKFRYIKVEYSGQPSIQLLREMFVDWFIHTYYTGTLIYNDMSIFQCMRDHMKIYSNSDGNGGVIVYNLYSDIVCPNGFVRWMFAWSGRIPLCFNFMEIPGVTISGATLTTTYKYLPNTIRDREQIHVQTHGVPTPYSQYFNTNSITVFLPEPSRTTDHVIEATGNVHGIFIKSEATIMSVKITLNNLTYIHYTNAIDIQMNTIKFGDYGWVFVPFDLERKYEMLSDCFVADHNGGLELGRIDGMKVEIHYQAPVYSISYAFPAYMSLHARFIIPELVCRNPRIPTPMSEYNVYRIAFKNPVATMIMSLSDIILNSEGIPAETKDVCVISHEQIEAGVSYVVCVTCSKPIRTDCVISWMRTPNAKDSCPHCRTVWREIDKDVKVYKQIHT